MIALSERIKLELRHRDPIEITELILDNSKATDIEGLTNEYKKLRHLSLVNVGLMSLKNFPSLPSLEKLDLSDNRISCGLEYLKCCPKLNHLYLSNNKLRSVNEIKCLSQLPNLETLDLSNCELSESENYRKKVFEMIPSLKYLDGFLEFEDVEESDYEYYENECYDNCYDSEEDEEEEGQNPNCAKIKQTNGKRGKYKSKVNYVNQEEDFADQLISNEFYVDDDYQKHSTSDLYDSSHLCYFDDYNETGAVFDEEPEDYECIPPSHGSKYVPMKIKDNFRSLKRSHCYSDEYETSTKIYCQDAESYSPVGTGLD